MTSGAQAAWPGALALVATLCRPDLVPAPTQPGTRTPSAAPNATPTHTPPSDETPDAAARLAARLSPADWDAFVDLAVARHRVAPVIAPALARHGAALGVPDAVRRSLDAAARDTARTALRQVAEVRRLSSRFGAFGVTPVVLKGWPLAERLYDGPAGRHGRDLDLYVPPEHLAACHAVMGELGYAPTPVHAPRGVLVGTRTLLSECNDIEYQQAETGLLTELMWRCHPIQGFPDLMQAPWGTGWQDSAAGRIRVPTARADMIYLSVHGTLHMWMRLKWLVDIARLVTRRGAATVAEDLEAARPARAWNHVALGLLLSARVFGTPLPPALADPPRYLVRSADEALARMAMPEERLASFAARLGFYRFMLRLSDDGRQRLGLLRFGALRRVRLRAAGLLRPTLGPANGGAGR